MEPDLWSSHSPMSFNQHGRLRSEMEMRSQIFSELNLELQRVLHRSAMDVGQVKGEDRCSSLVTIPGLSVISDVYHSPQATMEWWEAHEHTKSLHGGQSSPINQSALYEAFWDSQAVHVNHISSRCGSTVHIGCTNKSDIQEYDYPSVRLDGSPIQNHKFQDDLPDTSTLRAPFVQSLDRAACDTVGETSWPIGGWHSDAKAVTSTGYGSSRFSHSTSDNISKNFGTIQYCAQKSPVNQSTAPIDLYLAGPAGHTTYPSSPPSASWSPGTIDQDYQSCGNSVSDTSESPRHARDKFLVQSKQSGMSYREIRIKGQFKEAESTLRGRYRTLTKCREHRLRKPQWHAKDIQLLRQAVVEVSARSNTLRVRQPSSGIDAISGITRSSKISWKQVAEYISLHNGTYHFGNATCRKKWDEINGRLLLRGTRSAT